MSSEVISTVRCSKCQKSLGDLSVEEFNAVFADKTGFRLCFDCDPDSAATMPSIFWNWEEGDVFSIGGELHEVQSNALWPHARAHERTHERARARTHERARARGLSSCTYLNRARHNRELLEYLATWETCPKCHGQGFFVEYYGGESCETCSDFGSVLVLDKWVRQIIGGVVENV